MADIAKLTFDNVEFNIKDTVARRNSSFYIKGTQSQTTSNWTGTSDSLINLYEGLCIDYQLPYPSTTSDATFNLTFRNGTSTGAIPCYSNSDNRFNSEIEANTIIRMVYQSLLINSVTTNGWWLESLPSSGGGDFLYSDETIMPVSGASQNIADQLMEYINSHIDFHITGNISASTTSETFTDSRINNDHWEVDDILFGTPSNVSNDITWTTNIENHTITLAAIFSGTTTVDIKMHYVQ